MKTGRNDPCPCGSGKKYKHCCLSVSNATIDELKELLSSQEFDSLDDAQRATETLVAKQNLKPQDDFLGLSSEQVFRMLNFPYDTPELFQFSDSLPVEPNAPILMLIEGVVAAIDEKGLPATKVKGSLPRKLCRELWSDYSKLYANSDLPSLHKVNKEEDFFDLHVARIILELAGFLRKTKGRFYLTKKYQKIACKAGAKELYPIILKTYCLEYNWGYWDRFSEVSFIQQSFLFTLYLLKQYGEEMTLVSVYEDAFLRAFPMAVGEVEGSIYSTPEADLRHCYHSRACMRFLVFLGLAKQEAIKSDKGYGYKYKIKKTSLFDAVIHFNFIASKTAKTTRQNSQRGHLH